MTPQETSQVQKYIYDLQEQHAQQIAAVRAAEERKFQVAKQDWMLRNKAAHSATMKCGSALVEIEKLIKAKDDLVLESQFTQIVNYYCPDYIIPF